MAAVALLAGGDGWVAARLGFAMVALQASIGALNDVIDAPNDAGRKPGKPIPSGLVPARVAGGVVVAAAAVGTVLSVPSGLEMVGLAVVILAIGYGYDLRFKGTAWSWLPFAIGIPLLPVFGWLGTTGTLPAEFAVLIPVAVLAGAALAVANARADTERDEAAGLQSVALRLGPERSWAVNAGLLAIVIGAAIVTLAVGSGSVIGVIGAAAAGGIIGLGVWLGHRGDSSRRERAWELQAIGVGLLAAAWLLGVTVAT